MTVLFASDGKKHSINEQSDFLAAGGQAAIYKKGNLAFKVYHDPSKAIPVDKIKELMQVQHPNVITPQQILLNSANKCVGYSMNYVGNTVVWCRLVTQKYKNDNKISNQMIFDLIKNAQDTVDYIHGKNLLIVDINPMNLLVTEKYDNVIFIDTDSYQTPHFQADALMDLVRDFHAPSWTKLSDWFSFGVISFELCTGIHPYKGKHPKYKWPLTPETLKERMLKNASIFDSGVDLPTFCKDFQKNIPPVYLQWYKALFSDGKRMPPPNSLIPVIVITPVITDPKKRYSSGEFDISEIVIMPDDIIALYSVDGVKAMITNGGIYSGLGKVYKKLADNNAKVYLCHTPKTKKIVSARLEGEKLKLWNCTDGEEIPNYLAGDQIMTYGGRLYLKNGPNLQEIHFFEFGKVSVSTKVVAQIHPNASRLFDGVILQSLFSNCFATIVPATGESYTINIKEIKGKVIEAKFDNGVLMIIVISNGIYDRYVIRLSNDKKEYGIYKVENIDYVGLNFATLSNGVCINLNEKEELEIFSNNRHVSDIKVLKDSGAKGCRVFKDGLDVLLVDNDTIWSIKSKK